jgi:alanine dehydrogenase
MLILTRSEIQRLMTLSDYIAPVEAAFRQHAAGVEITPQLLHLAAPAGEFHIKAGGLLEPRPHVAIKANAGYFGNALLGLPTIQGVVLLFDGQTGAPLALLDSRDITLNRTAAVTVLAARHLARPDSTVATICGSGRQGRVQLEALRLALPHLRQVYVWDLHFEAASAFAEEMAQRLNIVVTPLTELEAGAVLSQVIVTCTPAHEPYLTSRHVAPGTFVAAIGADSPEKQELAPDLLAKNRVIVDILGQCALVGELHHAVDAGLMTAADVAGELGDLLTGSIPGRTSEQEIVIFDATGTALQDAAAAYALFERASSQGAGTDISLSA